MPSQSPAAAASTEELLELRGVVEAIQRTSAVVEFGLDAAR